MLRTLAATSLLLATATAGCADRTASYCDTLADHRQVLGELAEDGAGPGEGIFEASLPVFGALRDAAPATLVDEWDTVVFAWEGLAEAFAQAGVDPERYGASDTAPPSREQRKAIEDAAAHLRSPRVADATTAIEQHALDVCGVDLTGSQLR